MKKLSILLAFAVISALGILFAVGSYLSKPSNHAVNMPDTFENVVLKSTHGSILRAEKNSVCALLMHGVRSDRSSMIGKSLFLKENGITSLLIDLQAHGETPGDEITFGIRESRDAENGLQYLRAKENCEKVIAIGQSLGGASALLGAGPIKVDALILESVYPTIEEAVENRLEMRLGSAGRLLAPLLYQQVPLRINASLDELKPINALKKLHVPVFIISGTNDQRTKVDETKRMYIEANEPKQLWLVDGAAHEDLLAYSPEEYKTKIMDFIKHSL